MTQLLRVIFWIAVTVLGSVGWLNRGRWASEATGLIVGAIVVALLALAAWFAIDWRRGFDRRHGPPGAAK